jgi:hypothetical protein
MHHVTAIELPDGSWWDWEVRSFDGSRLVLVAGSDLTYGHGLEVRFDGVSYIRCPMSFHDAAFREPTEAERKLAEQAHDARPPVIAAFDADDGPFEGLIVADRVEVEPGAFRHS